MLKPERVSEVVGTCFNTKLPLEGAIAPHNVESLHVNMLHSVFIVIYITENTFPWEWF